MTYVVKTTTGEAYRVAEIDKREKVWLLLDPPELVATIQPHEVESVTEE